MSYRELSLASRNILKTISKLLYLEYMVGNAAKIVGPDLHELEKIAKEVRKETR